MSELTTCQQENESCDYRKLRAENEALAAALAAKDDALRSFDGLFDYTGQAEKRRREALAIQPHAGLVAKMKADAVRDAAKNINADCWTCIDPLNLYADRIERGKVE